MNRPLLKLADWPAWAAGLLVGFGLLLRLRQYLTFRSLWLDELFIANNIAGHSLRFLVFEKLDAQQAAPVGFLAALKAAGEFFGYQDFVLQFIPLFFGLAVLPAAVGLAGRYRHPGARVFYIGLLALAPVLIYYSTELKQYILDVFFCTLLVWLALAHPRWRFGKRILLAAGAAAVVFSHASVFVLAAVGLAGLLNAVRKQDRSDALAWFGLGAAWLAVFAITFLASSRHVAGSDFMLEYWKESFAPKPFNPAGLRWYGHRVLGLAYLGFSPPFVVSPVPVPGWHSPINYLIALAMLAGAALMLRRDPAWGRVNLLITLLPLAASLFHQYPFGSRLILFLVPVVFSWLAFFLDELAAQRHAVFRWLAAGLGAAVLLYLAYPAFQSAVRPQVYSDYKGAIGYVTAHHQPGDQLAVSRWSMGAQKFYAHRYPLEDMRMIVPVPGNNDAAAYLKEICTQQDFGRTWFIFTHRFEERVRFLDPLAEAAGPPILVWEGAGAATYLFDLTPTAACGR
jgi:hypothetical protein